MGLTLFTTDTPGHAISPDENWIPAYLVVALIPMGFLLCMIASWTLDEQQGNVHQRTRGRGSAGTPSGHYLEADEDFSEGEAEDEKTALDGQGKKCSHASWFPWLEAIAQTEELLNQDIFYPCHEDMIRRMSLPSPPPPPPAVLNNADDDQHGWTLMRGAEVRRPSGGSGAYAVTAAWIHATESTADLPLQSPSQCHWRRDSKGTVVMSSEEYWWREGQAGEMNVFQQEGSSAPACRRHGDAVY
jgi:hypothetical protein